MSQDYAGHKYAYRCETCGECLPPGRTKGLCGYCREEKKQAEKAKQRRAGR